jgi:hypothetical protein
MIAMFAIMCAFIMFEFWLIYRIEKRHSGDKEGGSD